MSFVVFLNCCLSGAIIFLQKPCQSFYVHDTNCIVLLWALLCAFVCQLLPLPLCERSLCCCAWFMLLVYVETFFFLAASTLVFYTNQLFFNVISCRCLFLSSGSFSVETTLFQLSSCTSFYFYCCCCCVLIKSLYPVCLCLEGSAKL